MFIMYLLDKMVTRQKTKVKLDESQRPLLSVLDIQKEVELHFLTSSFVGRIYKSTRIYLG
ncbi:hypothetical protein HanRHA438_Chr09g0379631 [Helianthus annuus]|nr:hypothetical protein HanRHA438_Chr09g0379631 [Helianthus annuus]